MSIRDPMRSMWTEALDMLEHADRLHRQFFQIGHLERRSPSWEPPIDVFETATEITVLIAMPGVAEGEVEVIFDGGALLVMAKRAMPAPTGAMIRRLEIPFGHFLRRVDLPQGEFQISGRSLVNGCLRLDLRKLG